MNASSPIAQALGSLLAERAAAGPPAEPAADGAAAETEPAHSIDPSPERYPTVMKALILIGLALNVVFLVVAVPFGRQFGGFGIAWSIGLVLILGYNFWTSFIRKRRRW